MPFGFAYVRTFYGLRDRFFRLLPIKRALIPAFGGILVGLIGLWEPQALAGGYGTIQQALLGQLPVKLMLILAVLKIFSTSFTISSGGSGGIFGPSLFIGAMIGGAVGAVSHSLYPHIVPHAEPYALVGMGAFFAGVAKTPIGALLMVSEMTGGYGLVVPLMFTSVIAILLCQPWSIFEMQVLNRFRSPAHRASMVINVLQRMKVSEVYNKDNVHSLLPQDMTLGKLREFIIRTNESFFPVVDEEIHLKGILSLPQIRSVIFDEHLSDLLVVGELASPPFSTSMEESLYDALVKFIESGYWQIPIEDENLGVVGMLRLREVMRAYQREIQSLGNE